MLSRESAPEGPPETASAGALRRILLQICSFQSTGSSEVLGLLGVYMSSHILYNKANRSRSKSRAAGNLWTLDETCRFWPSTPPRNNLNKFICIHPVFINTSVARLTDKPRIALVLVPLESRSPNLGPYTTKGTLKEPPIKGSSFLPKVPLAVRRFIQTERRQSS